jgi:lysophospholipase L1-like esterase
MRNKIIIFGIIALVFFFILEIFLHYLKIDIGEFDRKFHPCITRVPNPYIMFKGLPGASIYNTERINSYGYRGASPSSFKDINEYRIFILGGSTTFDGNPSIPAIVQEEFIKNGFSGVKVFNYGVVSSVSSMELARVIFEVLNFQPDLIVMYNGANDIIAPLYWDPRPGYPYNFIVYENNPLAEKDIKKAILTLVSYSHVARLVGWRYFVNGLLDIEEVRKTVSYNTEQWQSQIAEIYISNMIKAGKISKAFGSDFVVFFQPMAYFKDYLSSDEARLAEKKATEHSIDVRVKILSKVSAANISNRFKFEDLSDIFDQYEQPIFTDFVHVTQEGHYIIGKAIYNYIVKNFKVSQSANKR